MLATARREAALFPNYFGQTCCWIALDYWKSVTAKFCCMMHNWYYLGLLFVCVAIGIVSVFSWKYNMMMMMIVRYFKVQVPHFCVIT